MSTLYQHIPPSERSQSISTCIESRESHEHEAAASEDNVSCEESCEHDSSPAGAALKTNSATETTHENGKVVLSQCLFSDRVLEWLVHFLSISISIGICLLHLFQTYWADESTWTTSWRLASLSLNDIFKVLQFAAKAHEVLIVASIGAIVLQFARRRLVGHKGIALGVLMGSYRIETPVNILSSKVWSALSFDTSKLDLAALGLGLLLIFSTILC